MTATMSTADVLRAAKALIDTPEKWTKGTYAEDARGVAVGYDDPDACRFCSSGALKRVGATVGEGEPYTLLAEAFGTEGPTVCSANDEASHTEVMAAFDRAIAAAEASA